MLELRFSLLRCSADNSTMQVLGAARGKVLDIRADSPELLDWIRADMEQDCPAPLIRDERGWCRPPDRTLWRGGDEPEPLGLMANHYYDVGSRGARMGRTCSFISAVWCEMLRAYTVSLGSPICTACFGIIDLPWICICVQSGCGCHGFWAPVLPLACHACIRATHCYGRALVASGAWTIYARISNFWRLRKT